MTSTASIPEFAGFRITHDGVRGDIVLNQPDRLNPLSGETLLDLEQAARWFDARPEIRVVVVRGEGRAFDADEAKTAGFLNQVVDGSELGSVVDQLAATVASKPAYATQATKSATNAVTRSMVGLDGSWSDADSLGAGLADPEGRASAAVYLNKMRQRP